MPENVTVIGGKTGTTEAAGSCLVYNSKTAAESQYISGGSQGQFEKRTLYAYDRTAHKFFKGMRWIFRNNGCI